MKINVKEIKEHYYYVLTKWQPLLGSRSNQSPNEVSSIVFTSVKQAASFKQNSMKKLYCSVKLL